MDKKTALIIGLLFLAGFYLVCIAPGGGSDHFGEIDWDTKDYDKALKIAKEKKKPLMIVFGASW